MGVIIVDAGVGLRACRRRGLALAGHRRRHGLALRALRRCWLALGVGWRERRRQRLLVVPYVDIGVVDVVGWCCRGRRRRRLAFIGLTCLSTLT